MSKSGEVMIEGKGCGYPYPYVNSISMCVADSGGI